MRPEEVLSVPKAKIDIERNQLHIPRGKTAAARRTLDLTPESRLILGRRMPGDSPWAFPSPSRPARHLVKLNGAHDQVCKESGLSFVLYDFRHTFATRMAQQGIDLATIASILGHNSIRMVQRYVHITADHKRAAMERYASQIWVPDRDEQVQ